MPSIHMLIRLFAIKVLHQKVVHVPFVLYSSVSTLLPQLNPAHYLHLHYVYDK